MSVILFYKKENVIKYTDDKLVLDYMYYQKARLPTAEQLKAAKTMTLDSTTKKIVMALLTKYKDVGHAIEKIKKLISKINYKIPLYDEYTKNLYIIGRDDIYEKVIGQYYRLPDEYLIKHFEEQKKQLGPHVETKKILYGFNEKKVDEYLNTDIKYNVHYTKMDKERKFYKLLLMTDFLEQFNINILKKTYIETLYYYSDKIGKNLTMCVRPSFLPHLKHITPYYTREELFKLGLNLGLIKIKDFEKNKDEELELGKYVTMLCQKIQSVDLSANIIKEHQTYILQQDMLGMMQYYTLQGSFFMNQYLRNKTTYNFKNELLEKAILSIWTLINNAPAFDKTYTVYRFIRTDEHLQFLQVGDEYITNSFESTTRDAFYPNISHFGFILVKITIPAAVKGVALCIESISNFPEEQEIIFAPGSKFRLEHKDNDVLYYHIDSQSQLKIETKYEFTYIGASANIKLEDKPSLPQSYNKVVDFRTIDKRKVNTVAERVANFIQDHINPLNQFDVLIDNKLYTIMLETYDSTSVYKKFYSVSTNNGLLLYTIIDNYIGFTLEIGDNGDKEGPYMHVNYYYRFNSVPKSGKIDDKAFLYFLIYVAYYFEIPQIKLYCEHNSCENLLGVKNPEIYNRGNYCVDFYLYLKFKIKKYSDFKNINLELIPNFKYSDLDLLKRTDLDKILNKADRDELYQIYDMTYKHFFEKEKYNVADFYIWLIENYCMYVDLFISKLNLFVGGPFTNDFYMFDVNTYLYNKKVVDSDETSFVILPKNKYRL